MSDGKKLRSIDHGVSFGNPVERVGLEDVDARVDRVARDLVRVGLLQEPPDVAVRVGLDQPVRAGVVDRRQHDRRLGLALAVQRDDGRQIHLRQDVAVEHDDRLAQRLAGVAHRAARAERRRLDDVADREARVAAVAEDLLDAARLVVEAEDHLVDLRHLLQQVELVVEERPIEDRDDRFGRVDGERAEPRALCPLRAESPSSQPPMISFAIARPMNLPNSLTLTRIFLVPLLVVVLLTKFEGRRFSACPNELVGAAIFGLASLTDWLDGYLARRRKQITPLGQVIDPLADKLLTCAALISLVRWTSRRPGWWRSSSAASSR